MFTPPPPFKYRLYSGENTGSEMIGTPMPTTEVVSLPVLPV